CPAGPPNPSRPIFNQMHNAAAKLAGGSAGASREPFGASSIDAILARCNRLQKAPLRYSVAVAPVLKSARCDARRSVGEELTEHRLDLRRIEVAPNDDDSRAPVLAWPGGQLDRRVEEMLHAVHRDRPVGA